MSNPKIPKGYKGHYMPNSNGDLTLIMVTNEPNAKSIKGANKMSDKNKSKSNNKKDFVPTFKKLDNMTDGERAAFKQGCITANNSVKENLGLKQKRENK